MHCTLALQQDAEVLRRREKRLSMQSIWFRHFVDGEQSLQQTYDVAMAHAFCAEDCHVCNWPEIDTCAAISFSAAL